MTRANDNRAPSLDPPEAFARVSPFEREPGPMPSGPPTTARSILALLALWVLMGTLAGAASAAVPKKIIFPVVGKVSYTDDFGAPRAGHRHRGNDIMAKRWSPVVAVEAGRIERPSWSGSDCALILHGASGTEYWYLHLNDQARDGSFAGCKNGVSYAARLRNGDDVAAGQLIGFVGNSGNARAAGTHLHFELHLGGVRPVSPYGWLRAAPRLLFAPPPGRAEIRVALYGRLLSAAESLTLRVHRVAVSHGWRGTPARRRVNLVHAPGMAVERVSGETVAASPLSSATVGERVSVWTTVFAPSLAAQLARPGSLLAERVRLRGEPG
jgi:peptidoglycan LD-endopeptidase LytH